MRDDKPRKETTEDSMNADDVCEERRKEDKHECDSHHKCVRDPTIKTSGPAGKPSERPFDRNEEEYGVASTRE